MVSRSSEEQKTQNGLQAGAGRFAILTYLKNLPSWLRDLVGYSLLFAPWLLSFWLGNNNWPVIVLAVVASIFGLVWLIWLACHPKE